MKKLRPSELEAMKVELIQPKEKVPDKNEKELTNEEQKEILIEFERMANLLNPHETGPEEARQFNLQTKIHTLLSTLVLRLRYRDRLWCQALVSVLGARSAGTDLIAEITRHFNAHRFNSLAVEEEISNIYKKTGKIRSPLAGEWFEGYFGKPVQAMFDFNVQEFPILEQIVEEEVKR